GAVLAVHVGCQQFDRGHRLDLSLGIFDLFVGGGTHRHLGRLLGGLGDTGHAGRLGFGTGGQEGGAQTEAPETKDVAAGSGVAVFAHQLSPSGPMSFCCSMSSPSPSPSPSPTPPSASADSSPPSPLGSAGSGVSPARVASAALRDAATASASSAVSGSRESGSSPFRRARNVER